MTRYVWLNISNGEFSNSWNEEDEIMRQKMMKRIVGEKNWKLIKYECTNDEKFEFSNLMRIA